MKKPNVILILTDNQEAATLGCYGNPEAFTPRLDAMAAEGVAFDRAFCPNAMCSPCRASVLTGLMPSEHGVHSWLNEHHAWPRGWNALDGIDTLPELMKAQGYATGIFGKYHLGDASQPQNGFDHWVTMQDGHVTSFWNNTVNDNGTRVDLRDHTVDYFTDKAIEFITARHEAGEPFLAYIPYPAPYGHWPATRAGRETRHHARFADCPMDSIERRGLSDKALALYKLQSASSTASLNFDMLLQAPNDLATLRDIYAQIALIDENVGRLLDRLDALDLAGDTLVIYTADHGLSLGQHGFWGHGASVWPASMHRAAHSVPLIMRRPGHVRAGGRVACHVSNHDIFSTVLDHAGIAAPQAARPISSRSLQPFLTDSDAAGAIEDIVFADQEETRAVRTADFLYFQRFKGSATYPLRDELYDLRTDPGEERNVIDDPAYGAIAAQLRARCEAFFARHTVPEYDLWTGGRPKDNTIPRWLWADAWGSDWAPTYDTVRV